MARGPKGKPVALHLVDGTFKSTRHADAALSAAAESDGSKPEPPIKLDKEQKQVWDFYVKHLHWLSAAESDLLLKYVVMVIDHRKRARGMATAEEWNASMITAFKTVGAELGVGFANKQKIPGKKKDEKAKEDKYFK